MQELSSHSSQTLRSIISCVKFHNSTTAATGYGWYFWVSVLWTIQFYCRVVPCHAALSQRHRLRFCRSQSIKNSKCSSQLVFCVAFFVAFWCHMMCLLFKQFLLPVFCSCFFFWFSPWKKGTSIPFSSINSHVRCSQSLCTLYTYNLYSARCSTGMTSWKLFPASHFLIWK